MSVRFVMVGGFLGAGKTTALGRLACLTWLREAIGVVTNDQAHDLVDTNTFRNQGLRSEEVQGVFLLSLTTSFRESAHYRFRSPT